MSVLDGDAPAGVCANCGEHPATEWWIGEASVMDLVHGYQPQPWCGCCCVKAQIEAVQKQVARLEGLEAELLTVCQ